jgi:hypothetical protein
MRALLESQPLYRVPEELTEFPLSLAFQGDTLDDSVRWYESLHGRGYERHFCVVLL